MSLLKLIPKIFYSDVQPGRRFFTEGLGFTVNHHEGGFCIISRDHITLYLVENEDLAKGDRPEIRIETDDIEAFYQEISEKSPQLLHPNLNSIKQQPWGLKEFALLDDTGVCVIIHQQ